MPMFPLLWAFSSVVVCAQDAPAAPKLELLNHAQLSSDIHALADAHKDLVQVLKLGTSRAGRPVEALRFAGAGAAEDKARPSILLVANLDGARVYSSAVALQHAHKLADGYASDEKVKKLLDTTNVFIVPRANPDAAEARFAKPLYEQHASGPGVDDDRDGRMGEDPPADVNGDGIVSWIRVKDPDGEWKEDPTEPRALVKADRTKGERGVYKLWPEGRDSDKDEKVAEDAPLDARVDKNFPAGWEQHTAAAGVFPTDEPETRGLCDFVLQHTELALVVVYDAQDDLVGDVKSVGDEAPNVKRIPPEGVLESDAKLLGELGKRFRKITESAVKSDANDKGSFGRWCYEDRGLLVLSSALWDISLEDPKKDDKKDAEKKDGDKKGDANKEGETKEGETKDEKAPKGPREAAAETASEGTQQGRRQRGAAGEAKQDEPKQDEPKQDDAKKEGDKKGKKDDEPKPSDDAKRLKWIDAAGASEAWRFVAWTPFQHPELGAVEIGGLAPYARLEPPAADSGAIAAKHFDWFLTLGELVARVTIAECTRETLGDGVYRVKAVIEDDSYLPLLSRSARRTESTRPAKIRLELPTAGKLLGGEVQSLLSDLPGSGGRKEYSWLVAGPAAMEIAVTVESAHAGTAQRKAEEKKK